MTDQTQDTINQAQITVTYYFGPGDSPPYLLSKKYLVKNWQDETDLRRILDELAGQLNHISGYGILSIDIAGEGLQFKVDYKERFKPFEWDTHEYNLGFGNTLRFEVGRPTIGKDLARLEIPRLRYFMGNSEPIKKYEVSDTLFHIRANPVGNKKKQSQKGTMYHLDYDRENSILKAFLKNITEGGVLAPVTKHPIRYHQDSYVGISWWKLPTAQHSWTKWEKERKQKEKEAKKKERLKKSGIVYKDKKRTKKADQVYIIGMDGDGVDDVYKIGVSNNPKKRLQALNTSNPFPLKMIHRFVADKAADAEAQLHAMFAESRTSGEWFRLTPEQVANLKRITEFRDGQFVRGNDRKLS